MLEREGWRDKGYLLGESGGGGECWKGEIEEFLSIAMLAIDIVKVIEAKKAMMCAREMERE